MEELKQYEIGYLLTPLIAAEEVEAAALEVVRQPLEALGGTVVSEKAPAALRLAYPIGKVMNHKRTNYRDGYFGAILFTLPTAKLADFKERCDKQDQILRFLLINQPPVKAVAPRAPREVKSVSDPVVSEVESKKAPMSPEEIDREIEDLLVPTENAIV